MMDPKVEAEYEEYKAAGRIWGVIDKENIKKIKFPRVPKEIVDGFKALEDDLTGTVSDILDALGYNKVIPANVLPPIEPGHLIVGTAVTLRSIPIEKTTTQGLRDHDFIKMASREVNYLAEPGDVLVGDAGGMTEMSSMGGQSFVSAKIRGLEGVVIDGAVRDVGEIRKYGVPTWCRGATPKTGKCRIEAMEMELRKCGGVLSSEGGTITIIGCAGELHAPGEVLSGHNDHRVVMSLAVLALAAGLKLPIAEAEAVTKSWPNFFTAIKPLGAEVQDVG